MKNNPIIRCNMAGDKWTLGIESTAHTFSFGLVDASGIPYPSKSDTVRPLEGGIHPREAADHHRDYSSDLFQEILLSQNLTPSDIGAIAYSQGPGLGPCLRIGASVARTISSALDVPLIGVNHCVAHIEIGRQQCDCDDPVLLRKLCGICECIQTPSRKLFAMMLTEPICCKISAFHLLFMLLFKRYSI